MKYTLLKNKTTGERSIRINKTGEVIRESDNTEKYEQLRKRALTNLRSKSRDDLCRDMGLVKVRGSVSGKVYWE